MELKIKPVLPHECGWCGRIILKEVPNKLKHTLTSLKTWDVCYCGQHIADEIFQRQWSYVPPTCICGSNLEEVPPASCIVPLLHDPNGKPSERQTYRFKIRKEEMMIELISELKKQNVLLGELLQRVDFLPGGEEARKAQERFEEENEKKNLNKK